MDNEFRVIIVDSGQNIDPLLQIPKYEVQLSKNRIKKLGLIDSDLIEIKGTKITAARVVSSDDFQDDVIGLNELTKNNAGVSSDETVTIRKADSKAARKIIFAPIGKHLKKSELLNRVAKKSFSKFTVCGGRCDLFEVEDRESSSRFVDSVKGYQD